MNLKLLLVLGFVIGLLLLCLRSNYEYIQSVMEYLYPRKKNSDAKNIVLRVDNNKNILRVIISVDILMKKSNCYHEDMHEDGAKLCKSIYKHTYWLPFSKMWKVTSFKKSHVYNGVNYGQMELDGGRIAQIIGSLMPFALLLPVFLGFSIWLRIDLIWKIIFAGPLVYYSLPLLIGSIPSKDDFVIFAKNSFLLVIPMALCIFLFCSYPKSINITIMFLTYTLIMFVVVLAAQSIPFCTVVSLEAIEFIKSIRHKRSQSR